MTISLAAARLVLTSFRIDAENAGMGGDHRAGEDLDDARLVARVRGEEDRRAFATLYARHRRRVLAVLLHLLREPAAAEDLCHDAFVRAWERIDTLRGDFEAWIVRIAANLALNLLRQRATHRRLEPQIAGPADEAWPERAAAAREEGRLAISILRSLGREQRAALSLRYLDGLSRAEIAARLGLSEEQVRSSLQNGRRNFHLAWRRLVSGAETRS
jgi:RNA polymerase sigma-70 factor (ECF subfamily)